MLRGLRCYAMEDVVVADTAIGLTAANLTLPENTDIQCTEVWITFAETPVNFSLTAGFTPTSSTGLYVPDPELGNNIIKLSYDQAKNLLAIRTTGVSARMSAAYMTDR